MAERSKQHGDFAAVEDVVPQAHRAHREVLRGPFQDPFIDALVPAAGEDQPLCRRQLGGGGLGEPLPRRGGHDQRRRSGRVGVRIGAGRVVGNPESLVEESHSDGLLEYPVYTKPSSWRDRDVPAVLLSGNHGKIAQWRRHEQYRRTAERRPDLLVEFDAGKLPRADRTAFSDLGYDVVDGRLLRRPDA